MKPASKSLPPRGTPAEFDRDAVLVCMVLAFCIAAASINVVYNILG